MTRKTRIFINIHYLEIGGAETALIGMLQALDPEKYDVDLFVNAHRGEMMEFIPKWVNLLPEIKSYSVIESPIAETIKRGCFGVAWGRWRARRAFDKYSAERHPQEGSAIFGYIGRYVTPHLPSLRRFGHYDLAISYLTPHNVVLDKVDADKKICWIHTDYSTIDVNAELELPVWSGFDRIISISDDVTRTFLQRFPSLSDKIEVIENVISPEFIRERAASEPRPADMPPFPGGLTLLTIGRYCHQKKLDEIPDILNGLLKRGLNARWYIMGYGSEVAESAIIRRAYELGVSENLIMLGKRTNPYPYIKACDWYVQPSRYEGKSVTVREAQILGRPVIVTAYPTATSQVSDGVDGVIVPLPLAPCIEAIARVLSDPTIHTRLSTTLSTTPYSTAPFSRAFASTLSHL